MSQQDKPIWARTYEQYYSDYLDWPLTAGILSAKLKYFDERTLCKAIEWGYESGQWRTAPRGGQLPIIYRQYEAQSRLSASTAKKQPITSEAVNTAYKQSCERIANLYGSMRQNELYGAENGAQHVIDEVWEVICAAGDMFADPTGATLSDRVTQYAEQFGFNADDVSCRKEWKAKLRELSGSVNKRRKVMA